MIYPGEPAEYKHFGYFENGKTSVATATTGKLAVIEGVIHNRSGSATHLAMCTRMKNADWKIYDYGWTTASTVGVERTASAQTGSTFSVVAQTAGVGIIIASPAPFGFISVTSNSAPTGDPGYVYTYYNGATQVAFTPSIRKPTTFTAGDTNIVFSPPADWAVGNTAAVDAGSVLSSHYCLRMVASAAATASGTVNRIFVGRTLFNLENVANYDFMSVNPREDIPLRDGEGVVPFYGAAASTNVGTVATKNIKTPG